MKIATFNINGINTRLANLRAWLEVAEPDVVCLQELKATDAQFPDKAVREAGYDAVWKGEHRWNGVAILSRIGAPVVTRRELPGEPADAQSRYIEAAVGGVLVGCLYLPNGNPQPGPKFDYKLAWFERLIRHAEGLVASEHPVDLVIADLDGSEQSAFHHKLLKQQPAVSCVFVDGGLMPDAVAKEIRTRIRGDDDPRR